MSYFFKQYDLLIAFGLIGIIIMLYLIYRLQILPKKSLPYLAATLAGVFGFAFFKKWRSDKLNGELKELEKELKKKEEKLKEIKNTYEVSDREMKKFEAELDQHRKAYEKEILLIRAEKKGKKEEIERLSGDDLHDTFRKAFAGYQEKGGNDEYK